MGYAIPPVETNAQIDAREKAEAASAKSVKDVALKADDAFLNSLAGRVKTDWELAKHEKYRVQEKMIDNLLQKRGEYDAQKLAQIRELGSEIFMMITDIKCRTALAMLREIYANPAEKPWKIEPTPLPELTPEAQRVAELTFMKQVENFLTKLGPEADAHPEMLEEIMTEALPKFKKEYKAIQKEIADDKAEAMMQKMEDQLIEGGYYKALLACLADIVTLKAGFLKGPVYRKKKVLKIVKDGQTRKGKVAVKEEIRPEWDSPSAFDVFPLPGVVDINKGGIIELLRYTRTDLQEMIGLDGFDEVAIRKVLESFADKGLHQWTWDAQEIQRAEAEGRETAYYYEWDTIDCLEYHNAINGKFILDWAGIQPDPETHKGEFQGFEIDPNFDYQAIAWVIDQYILKISINEDPLGNKNYYKTSYVEEKGTFWGRGVPETITDGQTLANSIMRALQNNVGIASGPQIGLDTESLAPGQDPNRMWPWKIWRFIRQAFSSKTEPFMQFFQPQMHVQELVVAYDKSSKICDEHSGIAGWTHGDRNIGGAGNTASGFSMFAGMQNRGIKDVALQIDMQIVQPSLEALYYDNYFLDESLEYIGDCKIQAKGSSWILLKETQAVRRNDFLRATANPIDEQLMGIEGRREALYETAKDLFPNPRKIVPDADFVKPIPGAEKGMAPPPGETPTDMAGNRSQGVDYKIQPGPDVTAGGIGG